MDYAKGPDLKVWDLQTGNFLRWIPHPPPPPGKPALSGFEYIQNAGDVNGDGWDDLFFQDWTLAGDGVAGCLDGQTGQAIWMDYDRDYDFASRVLPIQPGPMADLNADGISDFVVGINTVSMFFQFEHRITAYSGSDGSIIWRRNLSRRNLYRFSILCTDIDGDQVDDLISLEKPKIHDPMSGELMALSGSTGATIWSRDCSFVLTFAPNASTWGLIPPIYVSPSPDGDHLDLMIHAVFDNGGIPEATIATLNAKTGDPLETIPIPDTIEPWHSTAFTDVLAPTIQAGDYDGDGFQEIATIVYLGAEDTNSTTIIPGALVILGQRTLFGPDKPQVGSLADFKIALPAHPGAPFQLAFSAGFSPRTDIRMWKPQNWPTMLRQSGLVQRTSTHPGLQGHLDANGQGSVTVRFPSNPAYVGLPVYARALIADPLNPSLIRTQTSLHFMVIQP